MPISFTNYIDITSGVIGSQSVAERQLILRVFSSNPLIPANSYTEFTNVASVGAYFGVNSPEYAYAVQYFGFVSKTSMSPGKISFASWVTANTAPILYGDPLNTQALSYITTYDGGNEWYLNLTIGGVQEASIGPINLSGAASLSAVAALIQTSICAASSDADFTGATVTYNATTSNFVITGGVVATTSTQLSISAGFHSGADLGQCLGLEPAYANPIISYGTEAQSVTATLTNSTAASTNFGSFVFIPTLTVAQATAVAQWNVTNNNAYMFLVPVTASNAAAMNAALIGYAGTVMTLSPTAGLYPEITPGAIQAATDYTKPGASQNYMWQAYSIYPATVTDNADFTNYNTLRVNYYGQTQTAGQSIVFYQRGTMCGGQTAPTDINVYSNEQWLKSDIAANVITLLLSVGQVPANGTGTAMIMGAILPVLKQAETNGTIQLGNQLSSAQIAAINSITGDNKTWQQIQTKGWWLNITFGSIVTSDGRTEWSATYQIIYTKDNAIRSVVGSHSLV